MKSQMVWIVFVVVSFSSSAYLLNEYSKFDNKIYSSVAVKEVIESEDAQEIDNYESNDFLILKNLSAIILKFLQSYKYTDLANHSCPKFVSVKKRFYIHFTFTFHLDFKYPDFPIIAIYAHKTFSVGFN